MSDLDLVAEVLLRHDTRSGRLLNGRVLVECDCPWAAEPFDPTDTGAWHRARWDAKRHEAEQVLAAQSAAGAVPGADPTASDQDPAGSVQGEGGSR